jgi:hypothetical protein
MKRDLILALLGSVAIVAAVFLSFPSTQGTQHRTLAVASAFTQAQKDALVKKHNDLRQGIAAAGFGTFKKATNMRQIVWNDAIASNAQAWANGKKFAHSTQAQRSNIGGYNYVGENLYIQYSTRKQNVGTFDYTAGIQLFYDEIKLFKESVDKYTFNMNTGHFTQVIWAETNAIGCGYSQYLEGGWHKVLLVCQYGVGGNWGNSPIYKQGNAAASACANGKSTTYSALCK